MTPAVSLVYEAGEKLTCGSICVSQQTMCHRQVQRKVGRAELTSVLLAGPLALHVVIGQGRNMIPDKDSLHLIRQ
jgi:hypothetical protein